MRSLILCLALVGVTSFPSAAADDFKLPLNLDKLAERATESVDVTLDSSMLQLASGFLSDGDADEAHIKKIVSKLKGVYVRSFEFDKDGQYSIADVDLMRAKLKSPEWSRIVGVKSMKHENADIYVKKNGDAFAGLVVISTEPRELTIVHIDGPINPEDLNELGGHMGIPKMGKHSSKDSKEED